MRVAREQCCMWQSKLSKILPFWTSSKNSRVLPFYFWRRAVITLVKYPQRIGSRRLSLSRLSSGTSRNSIRSSIIEQSCLGVKGSALDSSSASSVLIYSSAMQLFRLLLSIETLIDPVPLSAPSSTFSSSSRANSSSSSVFFYSSSASTSASISSTRHSFFSSVASVS